MNTVAGRSMTDFSKDLTDFRRRYEIAFGTEYLSFWIISLRGVRQAHLHVSSYGDWSCCLPRQLLLLLDVEPGTNNYWNGETYLDGGTDDSSQGIREGFGNSVWSLAQWLDGAHAIFRAASHGTYSYGYPRSHRVVVRIQDEWSVWLYRRSRKLNWTVPEDMKLTW